MNNKDGIYIFEGYIEALDTIRQDYLKWRMLKAVFEYETKGVMPPAEIAENGIFLLIKAMIDGRTKNKGGCRGEGEVESDSKIDSQGNDGGNQKSRAVCDRVVPVKKINKQTAGIKNKNINKNKKEIEKEIYKEKEQEKISNSSSSSSGVVFLSCRSKSDEDDEREFFDNFYEPLASPPEFEESLEEQVRNIEEFYFTPKDVPTLKNVQDFVKIAKLSVQPETFYRYYSAKGWLVNGRPMRDWRACILKWDKEVAVPKLEPPKTKEKIKYRNKTYTREEFDSMFFDRLDDVLI